MSIIKTSRNHVAAHEPMAGDVAVVSKLGAARVVQPIAQYDAAVQKAVALADHMQAHVDVVPVTAGELLDMHGVTEGELAASLTPAEREQLRQDAMATCAEAVRYSEDPAVVAAAQHTLCTLHAGNGQQAH